MRDAFHSCAAGPLLIDLGFSQPSAIILDIPAQALPNDHRFSQAKAVVDPITRIWVAGDADNFDVPLKGLKNVDVGIWCLRVFCGCRP